MYEALLGVKKDYYYPQERIVIQHATAGKTISLVKELLEFLDIPEYFIIYEQVSSTDKINFEFSPSHCIYPWINLTIDNIGELSPCCIFNKKIPNANIANDNIKDIYHSDYLKNLRKQFLQGNKPAECSACWKNEDVGIPSMRQGGKYKFRDIYYKIDYEKEEFTNLQIFDLKLGNACNLTCNICDRVASSKIAKKDLDNNVISINDFNALKKSVAWAESEHFWNQILLAVDNLKYLDIFGGEPLMSKLHFKFLKKLIELDVAKNIKIDYNTNGTIYSDQFFYDWSHFKEIKLSFSIDDIESRFESQRVGAKWKDVCNNIKKFNLLRSDKFVTEVFPTVNTQNVLYIPELLDWVHTQDFDHIAFNILHYPMQYNILSLSVTDKEIVINKFKKYPHYDICNSIIKLLENPTNIAESTRQININKV